MLEVFHSTNCHSLSGSPTGCLPEFPEWYPFKNMIGVIYDTPLVSLVYFFGGYYLVIPLRIGKS
jgi:hypothetical protein